MNCTQAAECVSALFDGEPISRETAIHLSDCEECRARLNDYAEMGAELRDLASTTAPRTIPEGHWRLAEPAAANNWLKKWRGTMRIPRFAFALMLLAIFALSGGLTLVKARAGGNGSVLWVSFRVPPTGQIMHLSARTDHEAEMGAFGVARLPGHVWVSARFVRREGGRVLLEIKTVYHDPELKEPNGCTADEALKNIPARDYWLGPENLINVPVEGLGNMEVSGEYLDHVPITENPVASLDPTRDDFRVMSPVLIRGNQVLLNLTGMSAIERSKDAVMLYSPGLGRFVFSLVPVQGATEGRIQTSEISFTLEGERYLLLTGAPITQSERAWVLYQPEWRPPVSQSSASGVDSKILMGDSLQRLLDWK